MKSLKGISTLEILIASALFVIIAAGALSSVVMSYKVNRFGSDNSRAVLYAQEGIEAMRHYKTRATGFTGLVNGTYGFNDSTGVNVLVATPNTWDKYTRTIVISDVQRNVAGNIVASGGTVDTNTKKITVNVTWKTTAGENKSISEEMYLSNWSRNIYRPGYSMLAYADFSGNDDVIKYRMIDNDGRWGPIQEVPDFNVPDNRNTRRLELYSSISRDEKIMVTKHADNGQFFYAQVWNGSNWGHGWALTDYSNDVNATTRNFDGMYLNNGKFYIAYDDFTYIVKYRTWDGVNWSNPSNLGNVDAYPVWITLRNQPGTNNGMAVIRDYSRDTNTFFFNGTSWGNQLEVGAGASDTSTEDYGFEWSQKSPGYGAVVFADDYGISSGGDKTPNIRVWRANRTWTSHAENVNITHDFYIADVEDVPNENEYLACFRKSNAEIVCMQSTLTPSWTNRTTIATTTTDEYTKSFDIGFEAVSGELALIVYSNGSNENARRIPKYRTYNPTNNTFSTERTMPQLGPNSNNGLETVRVIPDPISNDIMVVMADSNQSVYTIVWNGTTNQFYSSGDRALVRHGQFGSEDVDMWYDFDW